MTQRITVMIGGLECLAKYRITEIIADALGEYGMGVFLPPHHGAIYPPEVRASHTAGYVVELIEVPGPVPNAPADAGVA